MQMMANVLINLKTKSQPTRKNSTLPHWIHQRSQKNFFIKLSQLKKTYSPPMLEVMFTLQRSVNRKFNMMRMKPRDTQEKKWSTVVSTERMLSHSHNRQLDGATKESKLSNKLYHLRMVKSNTNLRNKVKQKRQMWNKVANS